MFQTLRNVVLLLAVGAVAYVGLTGRDFFNQPDGPKEITVTQQATPAIQSDGDSGNQLELTPSSHGQYWVTAEIDGVEVRFLVDTGASHVMLSPEDAENLGYPIDSLEFSQVFRTASGYTKAAPVVLDGIRIGALEVDEVPAVVNEVPMTTSLLGMNFLRRLSGYQVEDGNLILYW